MGFEAAGEGALFKNKDKRTDSSPDFTGKITINGEDYSLSGWTNTGKPGSKIEGEKYISVKASVRTADGPSRMQQYQNAGPDDDILF